jgi:two-component system response regulator
MNNRLAGGRPAEILLVEDNEDDVVLTQEGFKLSKLVVNLHHVDNGERCMAFLRKQGPFTDAPTPDLILLDINMPVMDGREVMAQIVSDEALRHFPVIVLTTSASEADILHMYNLRCSSYLIKPIGFDSFVKAITELGNYWFKLAVIPSADSGRTQMKTRVM